MSAKFSYVERVTGGISEVILLLLMLLVFYSLIVTCFLYKLKGSKVKF